MNVAIGTVKWAIFSASLGSEKKGFVCRWIGIHGLTKKPLLRSAWSVALSAMTVECE